MHELKKVAFRIVIIVIYSHFITFIFVWMCLREKSNASFLNSISSSGVLILRDILVPGECLDASDWPNFSLGAFITHNGWALNRIKYLRAAMEIPVTHRTLSFRAASDSRPGLCTLQSFIQICLLLYDHVLSWTKKLFQELWVLNYVLNYTMWHVAKRILRSKWGTS